MYGFKGFGWLFICLILHRLNTDLVLKYRPVYLTSVAAFDSTTLITPQAMPPPPHTSHV